MKSIAILHPKFVAIGGAENLVATTAEVLAQQNWTISIFTSEYQTGIWPNLDRLPVQTMHNRWRSLLRSKYFDAIYMNSRLADRIKNFDCIWAVNFPAPMWAKSGLRRSQHAKGVWYCNEPKRNLYPEITEKHIIGLDKFVPADKRANNAIFYRMRDDLLNNRNSPRNRRDRAWEKRVLKNFSFIQTVSEYAADIAREIYKMPTECCYPAVLSEPIALQERPSGQPWTVGTIATFAERKNLLNVCRALEMTMRRNPEIRVRIGAPNPQRLHDYWRDNGLSQLSSSKIEVVNTYSNSDLNAFYRSLDLNLYLTVDEPLGLIPIEAALCGTPSLLSDHAGPAELSKVGFGQTVSPFDDDAISDAILGSFGRRLHLKEQDELQRIARRNFGPDVFMKRFTRQLEAIKV